MHGPSTQWNQDDCTVIKELIGKWLFLLYSLFYGSFIVINVISPKFMSIDIGGLNIAIVYGIGLILFAILLAFAYNNVSTCTERLLDKNDEKETAEDGGSDS